MMDFESFRKDIETKLDSLANFELQEFHFEPYSFGNGILVYRIKGRIHKFVFDGRKNELSWMISEPHDKYFGGNFSDYSKVEGLNMTIEELEKGI